jgi:hypothetical protein
MALFNDALKFPFSQFRRLWWYWLNLIPVLGWILFAGYSADIARAIVDKKAKGLPEFGAFGETFVTGLLYTVLAFAWSIIAQLFLYIPVVGWVGYAFVLIIMPVLLLQYATSRKFTDGFNAVSATKLVFGNFWKYVVALLTLIGVALVWLVASVLIVTIPVTIPALAYGQLYVLARFYREAQ